MAAVVKAKTKNAPPIGKTEPYMKAAAATHLTSPLLSTTDERTDIVIVDTGKQHSMQINSDDSAVIGIITLEDVFEELLQVSCKQANLFFGT